MSDNRPQKSNPSKLVPLQTVWRVVGASFFFLVVGLGGMWLHFTLKEKAAIGLESLDPLPPATPIEQVAPNRVRLFFTADGVLLSSEMHEIGRRTSTYDRAFVILQALLRGPRSGGLRTAIPPDVKVRSLCLAERSATVDFSAELRDGLRRGPSAEALCVYSIVNSLLLNCSDLKTVTLLIEGRPVETLLGYLDLSAPLVENLAFIAEEKGPTESTP